MAQGSCAVGRDVQGGPDLSVQRGLFEYLLSRKPPQLAELVSLCDPVLQQGKLPQHIIIPRPHGLVCEVRWPLRGRRYRLPRRARGVLSGLVQSPLCSADGSVLQRSEAEKDVICLREQGCCFFVKTGAVKGHWERVTFIIFGRTSVGLRPFSPPTQRSLITITNPSPSGSYP